MKLHRSLAVLVVLSSFALQAQISKIMIPAGTPEDQAIAQFTAEQDSAKRLAMIQEFIQRFSANPAAVAFGNWQLSQYYAGDGGDLKQALAYGDKALAGSPGNIEILVSQVNTAQQMKDNAKVIQYATAGGKAFHGIGKDRPSGMSDADFAAQVEGERAANKQSYEFLQSAAFNSIVGENDAKARMSYIERYTEAFPGSPWEQEVMQYAIYSLQQMNDSARLASFGEKALAANPDSYVTLSLLASAFSEEQSGAHLPKAATYAHKAIELAKADAPDADAKRKLTAGIAHSALGYTLLRQEKAALAVPELKQASLMLRDDPAQYSTALYRLGYAYAKMNRVADAREALTKAANVNGPFQQAAKELLAKISKAK